VLLHTFFADLANNGEESIKLCLKVLLNVTDEWLALLYIFNSSWFQFSAQRVVTTSSLFVVFLQGNAVCIFKIGHSYFLPLFPDPTFTNILTLDTACVCVCVCVCARAHSGVKLCDNLNSLFLN
jgi:hypothetical protein